MEIVNNLNNLYVDDQYFMDVTVNQNGANVPTANIGIVGTSSRGPIGNWLLATSYPDFVKKFGDVDQAFSLTGPISIRNIFAQGPALVYFARAQAAANPAATASVQLKDATTNLVMTLQAATPGTWGNGLVATISTGTKSGTFKIQLQYGSESETWDNVVISQPATPISGAYTAAQLFTPGTGFSALATATFPATPNTNLPANGTYALTGGTDGTSGIVDADYVGGNTAGVKTGLSVLDSAPINYVAAAEQSSSTVNQALVQNAQNITLQGGLPRKAVVTFPRSTQPSGLASLTSSYDTDRGFACYAFQQIYDQVTATTQICSPLGFFLGLLAQLKPQESPGNKRINGSLGVDPNLNIGPADLTTIAQARVNVVGVPTPAGAKFGVRGGFTLSQTAGDLQQIYVRNMKDFLDYSVFQRSGVYVDKPITADLMRQVKQTVDDIFYPLKNPTLASDQAIKDYKIVCDSSNNPDAQQAQDILICDYAVKLLGMSRFLVFRTQISTGVVITSTQQGH